MENLSRAERDAETTTEERIVLLVTQARNECEISFIELKKYLDYYIKLFSNKYRIAGFDSDGIEQECFIALKYKAIEDFDPERGKFKSFAVLCIKRHLFSLIKSSNQQKRQVLNKATSLDEDRSGSNEGDALSLITLITEDRLTADEQMSKEEVIRMRVNRLLSKLSKLEQAVFGLYIKQFHYDEIVEQLHDQFPKKRISKKTVDNSLQRVRQKAQELAKSMEWN